MWEQIRANRRHAAVLVVLMAGLLFIIGWGFGEILWPGGGLLGLAIAAVIWVVMTLLSWFQGDAIFLAIAGARKIGPDDHPVLYNVVEEMKIASGLPRVPDVYIIDDPAPNAFATGRSPETASIAVTAGLLELLTRDELQGVVAHELGHVKNRDILYMSMVGIMMGTIVLLADIGIRSVFHGGGRRRTSSDRSGGQAQLILLGVALVLMILAPLVAQLIYFAVSRRREYLADASSALFTRYPEGLASALEKISGAPYQLASATRATAPMYIVNPLKVSAAGAKDVTSTHPPISERVRILRSMGGGAGLGDYERAYRKVTGRPVGVIPVSSLRAAPGAPLAAGGGTADPRSGFTRIRETTDLLWRLNQYAFIGCACGTNLKVPPAFIGKKIPCPHCGALHDVLAAPASAR